MKRLQIVILQVALLVLLTGCNKSEELFDSGKLTNAKAQRAVDKWIGNAGKVVVQGIQESPQENAAKVYLSFTDFRHKTDYGAQKNYSGSGVALFIHYTDGRWFLTKVVIGSGFDLSLIHISEPTRPY